jgi:hypothetical protein
MPEPQDLIEEAVTELKAVVDELGEIAVMLINN